MGDFPYMEWLARLYKDKASDRRNVADYIKVDEMILESKLLFIKYCAYQKWERFLELSSLRCNKVQINEEAFCRNEIHNKPTMSKAEWKAPFSSAISLRH